MSPALSQDSDSRFAELLNPIRDLTKNWEVDIAKYLEAYLHELADIRITFDGGVTTMNFVEAALLVQGSACVYSKKVEFLWQMVLQMLDLLCSKRSLSAPQGSRGSGAVAADINLTDEFLALDDSVIGRNLELKDVDDSTKDRSRTYSFLNPTPRQLVEKEGKKCTKKINIYSKKAHDLLGNKEDFRLNLQFCSDTCVVGEELSRGDVLGTVALGPGEKDGVLPADNDEGCESMPASPAGSAADEEPVEPEPPPLVPEPHKEGEVESEAEMCHGLQKQAAKVIPPPKPKLDLWKPLDPHEEVLAKKPQKKGKIIKVPPELAAKDNKGQKRKRVLEKESAGKKMLGVDQYLLQEMILPEVSLPKNVAKRPLSEFQAEGIQEMKNRADMLRKRRLRALKDLEDNEEAPMERLEEELQWEEAVPDWVDEDDGPLLNLPDPHMSSPCSTGMDEEDQLQYTSYEQLVMKMVQDYIATAQEYVESTDLAKRVAKWHDIIRPKLEDVDRRGTFDIHKYGSRVLQKFPQDSRKMTMSFRSIVHGEEGNEVVRYFLASLQLANTYNVEISKSCANDLSVDCMELTLLSRNRHHEVMDEYMASSEDSSVRSKRKGKSRSGLEEHQADVTLASGDLVRNRRSSASSSSTCRSSEDDWIISRTNGDMDWHGGGGECGFTQVADRPARPEWLTEMDTVSAESLSRAQPVVGKKVHK